MDHPQKPLIMLGIAILAALIILIVVVVVGQQQAALDLKDQACADQWGTDIQNLYKCLESNR